MGTWFCEVTKILEVKDHPNADRLSIVKVWDYDVITGRNEFNVGDLVSYISIESICGSHPSFSFLGKDAHKAIKAKKIRGIFSQGLVIKAPEGFNEGDSIADYYGIVRKVATSKNKVNTTSDKISAPGFSGENEKNPNFSIPYYDILTVKKYSKYVEDHEVVITEKLHGEHMDIAFHDNQLWIKSRNFFKRKSDESKWWEVAIRENWEDKLSYVDGEERKPKFPNKVFMGEIIGGVNRYRYNCKIENGVVFRKFVCFEVYDFVEKKFLHHDEAVKLSKEAGFEFVPELYRGKWDKSLYSLGDGITTMGTNIKEGFVVKAIDTDERIIYKLHGIDFLIDQGKIAGEEVEDE